MKNFTFNSILEKQAELADPISDALSQNFWHWTGNFQTSSITTQHNKYTESYSSMLG